MDALVKISNVRDQVGINPQTLAPSTNKVITYTVGTHGPFTLILAADQFTADAVSAGTQKTVDTLRALGQLTAQ